MLPEYEGLVSHVATFVVAWCVGYGAKWAFDAWQRVDERRIERDYEERVKRIRREHDAAVLRIADSRAHTAHTADEISRSFVVIAERLGRAGMPPGHAVLVTCGLACLALYQNRPEALVAVAERLAAPKAP